MRNDLFMHFYTGPSGLAISNTKYVYMIGTVSIRENLERLLNLFNYDPTDSQVRALSVVGRLRTFKFATEPVKHSWLCTNHQLIKDQVNRLSTHNVYVCWQDISSTNHPTYNVDGNIVDRMMGQHNIEDPFGE